MTLIYDSSFEGFLSLVYEVYYKKLHVKEISKEKIQTLLSDDIYEIQTDSYKAQKVLTALKNSFSKKNFSTVTNIFLCDSKNFEKELLDYIILGFKEQRNLQNINHPSIFYIKTLEKEFFSTVHKMKGFVRFEELDDETLYAKIDTKFNVLYFLGEHFLKRIGKLDFIIHDTKRGYALVKNKEEISIKKVAHADEPILSKDEEKFKKLWKTFFQSVSIEKRKNKKLQQNLVPLIYRTYMSEFSSTT